MWKLIWVPRIHSRCLFLFLLLRSDKSLTQQFFYTPSMVALNIKSNLIVSRISFKVFIIINICSRSRRNIHTVEQNRYISVRVDRGPSVLSIPGLWHTAHDGRQTQVQHFPRGIYLCRPEPVPGHHQHLPLHSYYHRRREGLGADCWLFPLQFWCLHSL